MRPAGTKATTATESDRQTFANERINERMPKNQQQPSRKDPVCGMTLSPKSASREDEYNGKTYYFCADVCREKFRADPEKYLKWHEPS